MKQLSPYIALAIVAVIGAVSYHSVGEIHYLKKFYPSTFTVLEAFLAAVVELIKVGFIAAPLLGGWKLLKDVMEIWK
jgi:hypothetical protein